MRAFVALNLPPARREQLHQSLATLRRSGQPLRWAESDALHLTLKFLGDIDGSEVARIEDAMGTIARQHQPVALQIRGLGAFPSLRRTSVLWLGVHPDQRLMSMQAELELAFSRLGYARETRPFRPHVTVARTRRGARPPDVEKLVAALTVEGESVADTVDLMRSHLRSDGSRYEVLLRVPLAHTETAA
jgi:RNA 2',3'-cyclic 3'-phosphodiesterase